MKPFILSAALFLLSSLAPAAEDKASEIKGDLGKFQGTWTAKAGPEKNVTIVVTFKGNAVTLKLTTPKGEDFSSEGEARLNEQANPHKTIDWTKFTGVNGDVIPTNLGLYEFVDADTVRLCSGGPGNERPTEFKAGEGGPPNLLVMHRTPAPK